MGYAVRRLAGSHRHSFCLRPIFNMGYHPWPVCSCRRAIKKFVAPLDKLDLINYIIDTNNEVRQWQRNLQRKTKSLQSKWVSAFTRGAGNETATLCGASSASGVLSTYYVSLCSHRSHLSSKGGSEMKKYMLYLKNGKGEYEPTAIGYFKDLVPLAFGHTAMFQCLGK